MGYKNDMTAEQCRGARGMLSLTRKALAERAKVARATLLDFESGRRRLRRSSETAIRTTLEAAGIEFLDGDRPGIRLGGVQ